MVEGGLLDDVTATVASADFVMWDYGGKAADSPAMKFGLGLESGDEAEQYWSVGNAKDWRPSPDGKRLIGIGSAKGINVKSNMGLFLTSIVNAGFPEDKLEDDISVFVGMEAHFIRVAAPKRPGLERAPREDGREFEQTVLVVDEIIKMPWDKGKGKGKSSGKSGGSGGDELSEEAREVMLEILSGSKGPVRHKDIPNLVLKAAKDNPRRAQIVKLLYSEEFLSSEENPWDFEDGEISL
jgi:hypothetical protein